MLDVVSSFSFNYPSSNESVGSNSLLVDEDGDFIVPRKGEKPWKEGVITIGTYENEILNLSCIIL